MILLSTAYFPPITWMALLLQNKEVTIDLHETYSKQSYRNRFQITTANGIMALSVPVKKPQGNHTTSGNITLEASQNWQQVHWKSILAAYQSSPFFLYYKDDIEALFKIKYDSLHQMNIKIITTLASLIGFQINIKYTEDFIPLNQIENDYRFSIHPKKKSLFKLQAYEQVFEEKNGFFEDLSVLDLLFNLGPESLLYLEDCNSPML